MDLPITPRTRSVILRYETDQAIPPNAAQAALPEETVRSEFAHLSFQPWGSLQAVRPQDAQGWVQAFAANDRFADELNAAEARYGDSLPVHLFGRAPLALMVHLGHRLTRRRLFLYQEDKATGRWVPEFDSADSASEEPFFQIEGLPATRQGGQGHVALTVEVTHSCDAAIQAFQARHGSGLLATVRLKVASGESHAAVGYPAQVARAVKEFLGALDAIHRNLEGAASVLLALACPASMAVALGTVINPNTHPPVVIHQYIEQSRDYIPVHVIQSQRRRLRPELTREQVLEAGEVLEKVTQIHGDLLGWLKEPAQKRLLKLLGGDHLLRSRVKATPSVQVEPLYRHLGDEWTFPAGLLLGFKQLLQRLGSQEDWEECVRLLFIHEAFHVQQGGPTSYSYSGSGRTGWVLEAVDYDADALAVQAALDYRRTRHAGLVQREGAARTASHIVWNALESVRVFEPERPVVNLSERRLRRYLIWLFHACRLHVLSRNGDREPSFERPFVEIAGLPTFPDPHETYLQQSVRLDGIDPRRPGGDLVFALYFRQEMARTDRGQWIAELLQALSRWEQQPREKAQREVQILFERFFDQHRFLVDRD